MKKLMIVALSILILTVGIISFSYISKDKDTDTGGGGGDTLPQLSPPSGSRDGGVSQVTGTSYTCAVGSGGTGDFCDVQGFVSNVNTPTSVPNVIFRTNAISYDDFDNSGRWFAINCAPSGSSCIQTAGLNGYCWYSGYTTATTGGVVATSPYSNNIRVSSGEIYVVTKGHSRKYTACTSADLTATPKEPYTSAGQEKTDTKIEYTVDWNFCPAGDSNFAYCNGANAVTTKSEEGWSGSTTEYRLNEGQLLQFDARDGKGNPLASDKFYTRVQKWDMSCNIEYANKCDTSTQNVNCKCPAGYTFKTSSYCNTLDGQGKYTSVSNVCADGYNCLSLDTYQACSGLNPAGCSIWATSIQECGDGKKCYVGSVIKEGLGQCKCTPTECSKGDRKTSTTCEYEECVSVSSTGCDYNEWQCRTCASGLHYDTTTKKCINQPNDAECTPFSTYKKCVGNDLYSCISNGIKDEAGNYRWYLSKETSCASPKECIDSGNFDYCGCRCSLGQVKCLSATEYQSCTANCWETKTVDAGKLCYNDAVQDKSSVPCESGGTSCPSGKQCNEPSKTCVNSGCAFGTETCTIEGQACDTSSNSPTYNTCVCKDDSTYCGNRVGELMCSGEKAYKQCTSSTASCPYWSTPQNCDSYSLKICQQQTGSDNCVCPTTGGNSCSNADASAGTTRCLHNPEQVQRCQIVNGCPQWTAYGDPCQTNYVCVQT